MMEDKFSFTPDDPTSSVKLSVDVQSIKGHGVSKEVLRSFQTGQCITTVKLNDRNYFQWSRSALLSLTSQNYYDYIEGEMDIPATIDPKYKTWRSSNAIVMSLLLRSMEPKISKGFMFAETARDLWEAVRDTYSSNDNFSKQFELIQEIHMFKQESLSLSSYYHGLRAKWDEIDFYQDYVPKLASDIAQFRIYVERMRIHQFLLGLHPKYEYVRVQVLGRLPTPTTVKEVFNYIQSEESRARAIDASPIPNSQSSDRAALFSHQPSTSYQSSAFRFQNRTEQSSNTEEKKQLRCSHCNRLRHTIENCWDLHRKPSQGKKLRRGERPPLHTYSATSAVDIDHVVRQVLAHVECHYQARTQTSHYQTGGSAPIPQIGTHSSAYHSSTHSDGSSWIIDSGANDHMTGLGDEEYDWKWM